MLAGRWVIYNSITATISRACVTLVVNLKKEYCAYIFRNIMLQEDVIVCEPSSPENNFQTDYQAVHMKIFMDYCYFIEKLWLDWKHHCLRSFTRTTESTSS